MEYSFNVLIYKKEYSLGKKECLWKCDISHFFAPLESRGSVWFCNLHVYRIKMSNIRSEIREAVREEVTRLLGSTASTSSSPSSVGTCELRRETSDSERSSGASSSRSSNPRVRHNDPSTSSSSSSSTVSFQEFYKLRESQRQQGCKPPKAKKKKKDSSSTSSEKKPTNVDIKVGLASQTDGAIKTRRGKTHVITVTSTATKEQIVEKAVEKHSSFDQSFDDTVAYVLLYPDYREVRCVPGTTQPFVLANYKQAIGKDYKRLTFYLLPLDDVDNSDDSDKELPKTTPAPSDIRNYGTLDFRTIRHSDNEEKTNLPNEIINQVQDNHPIINVDDQDNVSTPQAFISGGFIQCHSKMQSFHPHMW